MSEESEIIEERKNTHGSYQEVADLSQRFKRLHQNHKKQYRLTQGQREALDQIALKMARIVCGDPNCEDHWNDIKGYAELAKRSIEK